MKKSVLLLTIIILSTAALFSDNSDDKSKITPQEETEYRINKISLLDNSNVFNPYIAFYTTDITDFFNPEGTNKYPSTNLFDGNLRTCWVAGSASKNNSNVLYVEIPREIPLDRLILNIFSGYGKSNKLYLANARPKKIKISIYDSYVYAVSEVVREAAIIKLPFEREITLADTCGTQSFPLKPDRDKLLRLQKADSEKFKLFAKKNDLPEFTEGSEQSYFVLKLEITDVYKGGKYDDICISEIYFNNRFVTPNPDKYGKINRVYLQNDNMLMADYENRKGVVIYEDPAATFTMVDWTEGTKWAILHYVNNDEVSPNSRVEELYSLIDLKNAKAVNEEFAKRTAIQPYMSFFLEKNDYGRIFFDIYDEYRVELK